MENDYFIINVLNFFGTTSSSRKLKKYNKNIYITVNPNELETKCIPT